jgi:thiamine-phosphate diphosphorylase
MKVDPSKPILYLITRGASTETTTPHSPEFKQILDQVSAAVATGIDLIQLREKRLSLRVLYKLTERAAALTSGSQTRLLVNDRADVAASAGADGVHLTTHSIDAVTIRRMFGNGFLVGVSTHSLDEAESAKDGGADFVVFGPVFTTVSKVNYGPAVGLARLEQVATQLRPVPVLALGGINESNAGDCLRAGASGVAGISLFANPQTIPVVVAKVRQ